MSKTENRLTRFELSDFRMIFCRSFCKRDETGKCMAKDCIVFTMTPEQAGKLRLRDFIREKSTKKKPYMKKNRIQGNCYMRYR